MTAHAATIVAALHVSERIKDYGSYAGFAAVLGLAVLSLLYFAQAREVKRLREWAGRAPELVDELQQAAEIVRRAPAPAQAVAAPVEQRTVAPEPVAATNGSVALQPAQVAALAF